MTGDLYSPRLALAIFVVVMAFIIGCALNTESAKAVTGTWARNATYTESQFLCGTTWWACRDFTAPRPACFGRGGGTWECYGGITEQHKAFPWKWRNVGTYFYVGRYGTVLSRRTN